MALFHVKDRCPRECCILVHVGLEPHCSYPMLLLSSRTADNHQKSGAPYWDLKLPLYPWLLFLILHNQG